MTDSEHQLIVDNERLRADLLRVSEIARRALTAAREAQDAADGKHDPWLDEELRDLDLQGA